MAKNAVLELYYYATMISDILGVVVEWMIGLGQAGVFVVILIYIISCILMLPTLILASASGYAFGFLPGAACVSAGVVLGASAAFLIGRHWAQRWVLRKIADKPRLLALEGAVSEEGWRIVFLSRLCPIIPYRLANYAFSVTHIPFYQYVFATWLGTLPSAAFYAYIGCLSEELTDLHLIGTRSRLEWSFHIAAFVLLVVNIYYITKLSKRALSKHMPA